MLTIVYSSRATGEVTDDELSALLMTSRANNARDGLTGMLLYRSGRFIQLLEGEDDAVQARMTRIAGDPRHDQVMTLIKEPISERHFPDWTMGYPTATTDDASDIPGFRATFEDLDDDETVNSVLPALRELIRWFQVREARA